MSATLDRPLSLRRPLLYYGWVNLFVAAAAMTGTLPGRTHGLGLITTPLCADLHITEVEFGTINFIAIVLGAAFCLPGGRFLDRLGSRVMLSAVAAALGVVVLAMSVVADVTGLVVTLILVRGLGQGALSVFSLALPGKWFTHRLGPAMGVFAVLLAFGFIAATLAVGGVRMEYGWRVAWLAVGAALLFGLAPLSWLFVRDSPEACGVAGDEANPASAEGFIPPDEEAPTSPPTEEGIRSATSSQLLAGTPRQNEALSEPAPNRGLTPPAHLSTDFTLLQALCSPAFWTFGLATAHFGLLWSAITLFNEAILFEHGFDAQTFYAVMGLLTLGGLATNLLGGWLTTRWPLGRILFVGMVCLAAALVAFPFVHSLGEVLAYGFVLGMAGGLITVVHFTFYGKTFGRTHLGKIQGAAQVLSVLTSALGPVVLALVRDWTHSYDLFFYGSAPLAVLLGLAAWWVTVPRRGATGEENA